VLSSTVTGSELHAAQNLMITTFNEIISDRGLKRRRSARRPQVAHAVRGLYVAAEVEVGAVMCWTSNVATAVLSMIVCSSSKPPPLDVESSCRLELRRFVRARNF